jgi:hypothetical protein
MKIRFLFLFLFFSNISLNAQQLNVGIRIQKTQQMYWENGVSAQYSFANFKPGRLFVGFDFVTSRLGSAMNSNALKQDSYLLSGSYYFFKNKPYHLIGRLNTGFLKTDLEFELFDGLPSSAFLLSPELGMNYSPESWPVSLNFGLGYYLTMQAENKTPGTFQPLYYHMTLYYKLFNSSK